MRLKDLIIKKQELNMNHQNLSPKMKELSGKSVCEEINHHLDELSNEEIITLYYQLRYEHTILNGSTYYPNIKHLYATPFEREKDRREQQQWQKKQKVVSEVVDWYREA